MKQPKLLTNNEKTDSLLKIVDEYHEFFKGFYNAKKIKFYLLNKNLDNMKISFAVNETVICFGTFKLKTNKYVPYITVKDELIEEEFKKRFTNAIYIEESIYEYIAK